MTTNVFTTLVHEVCCNCSVLFGIQTDMRSRLLTRGGTFYCPNGHGQHYTKTENTKLKEQLAAAKENEEYYRNRTNELCAEKAKVTRRLSATKGQVTKIKNRVGNGVCPCCNRTFANVARHMKGQHPDFIPNE